MKTFLMVTVTMFLFFYPGVGISFPAQSKPMIQLAILLDTSNSMDGLINQAKTQLWKIVNELARTKRDGQSPELHVSLYEYGKSDLPANQGYMRLILPLTTDLDRISEELFRLKTNGGDEYCGMVIQEAVGELKWSAGAGDLKIIFIAGNEPFTQGGVDYREACRQAIGKGIMVNTIFCGSSREGMDTFWKDGADRAEGEYMNIDQNQKAVDIAAPQDDEIGRLSTELNKTYIGYGTMADEGMKRQAVQDAKAGGISPQVAAQRGVSKSSAQYRNAEWDLVDAKKEGKVKVSELKDEELPVEMRKMSREEREKYVDGLQKQREELQKKVQALNQEREKYVQEQWKKQTNAATFDTAVIHALHEQAAKKNFRFEK